MHEHNDGQPPVVEQDGEARVEQPNNQTPPSSLQYKFHIPFETDLDAPPSAVSLDPILGLSTTQVNLVVTVDIGRERGHLRLIIR